MSRFFQALLTRPNTPSTRLSRYTERCGYGYVLLGLLLFFAPGAQVAVGLLPPFSGQEEGMYRLIGMSLAFVGYFYVFGGRGQSQVFGLATVLDRLVVPLFGLYVLQVSTIAPMVVLPMCVLDPILAMGGYWMWRKDLAESGSIEPS